MIILLKKLFVIFLICLMLTSCSTPSPKTVTIDNSPLNYKISISKDDSLFRYNLSYSEDSFNFTPVDGTVPINFHFKNGTLVSENGGMKYQFPSDSVNSMPMLISKAITLSIDKEISADTNGIYKLYGSLREGEYVLTLSDEGRLKYLTIDNIKLKVEFT